MDEVPRDTCLSLTPSATSSSTAMLERQSQVHQGKRQKEENIEVENKYITMTTISPERIQGQP